MGMDRKIEKKKWPLKRILKFAAVGLTVIVLALLIISQGGGAALNVKQERITISTVTRGIFQEFIPVTGNVLPLTTRYLDAYEGGTVEQIYIRAGSQVKKGDQILKLSNIQIKGLMTIPPWNPDPEASRKYYHRLVEIQDILSKKFPQAEWGELSMGMSNDFEVAIQEGATIIRIGTAIVGPRV